MDKTITHMMNKGIKPIADIAVEAYVEMLLEQGAVVIDTTKFQKEDLIKLWTDTSKDLFKHAVKSKKSKAQTDKPKRAKSGYLLFCEERRPQLQADGLDFTAVAAALGQEWQALGDKGKETWTNKANELKEEPKTPANKGTTIEWATKSAQTFAEENNLTNKVVDGSITGTGKEKNGIGAIKLSDLKTWMKDNPEHDQEENVTDE